jgi:hypothetical protein
MYYSLTSFSSHKWCLVLPIASSDTGRVRQNLVRVVVWSFPLHRVTQKESIADWQNLVRVVGAMHMNIGEDHGCLGSRFKCLVGEDEVTACSSRKGDPAGRAQRLQTIST